MSRLTGMIRFSTIVLVMIMSRCAPPQTEWFVGRVQNSFDHDYRAYVQGFEIHEGLFWESTGQYGKSSLRVWHPETGKKEKFKIISNVFAEGLTLWGDRLYVLTWKAGTCYVFDSETFKEKRTFDYDGEGWGLTHNDQHLIMSNGSDRLLFLDPDTFAEERRINISLNGKPVGLLNELEYYAGEIWANIYQSKMIVSINPTTGNVTRVLNLKNLPLPQDKTGREEVLNGIAIEKSTGKIFVTGKYWSKVYQIELEPSSGSQK